MRNIECLPSDHLQKTESKNRQPRPWILEIHLNNSKRSWRRPQAVQFAQGNSLDQDYRRRWASKMSTHSFCAFVCAVLWCSGWRAGCLGTGESLYGGKGLLRFLGIRRAFGQAVRGDGKPRRGFPLSFLAGVMRWRSFAAVASFDEHLFPEQLVSIPPCPGYWFSLVQKKKCGVSTSFNILWFLGLTFGIC